MFILAEYKKKNVKKVKLNNAAPKRAVKKAPVKTERKKPQAVPMTPVKENNSKKTIAKKPVHTKKTQTHKKVEKKPNFVSYNVIIGDKAKQLAKKIKKFTALAVVIAIVFLISFMTPTGVFEYLQNSYLAMGSGEFPREIVGSQTVSSQYNNDKIYVISDLAYTVYNSKGKTILSDTHGFSKPFMKVSDARTLLLDQNGVDYKIYNLNGSLEAQTLKEKIITGDISRNGTYAIVTKPLDYASKVEVFNKNNKMLFSWSSSKEIVTAVCLSNNGKKIAVSTIYSNAGEYISKVYVFNYKNANPLSTIEYNQPVLYLKTLNASSFISITNTNLKIVKWRNQSVKNQDSVGNMIGFRPVSKSQFLVFCESENNNLETRCIVYNTKLEEVQTALFSGAAQDVSYVDGKFFCFDDNITYVIDKDGKITSNAECGYSVRNIYAKNSKTFFAVSDTEVKKIKLGD